MKKKGFINNHAFNSLMFAVLIITNNHTFDKIMYKERKKQAERKYFNQMALEKKGNRPDQNYQE